MKKICLLLIFSLFGIFLLNNVSSATWGAALNTSINHYYKEDNNALTDEIYPGLNGTNMGTINITGQIKDGRLFNGTNDANSAINFSSDSFANSVAYSFWFKTNSTSCTGDGCMFYYKGTTDTSVSEYISLVGTEIYYVFGAASGSNNRYTTSGAGINTSSKFHVVINGTGNGGTAAYAIWVNGVNVSTTFASAGANRARPTGSQVSNFGHGYWIANVRYTGMLDEIGIWNRTVTSQEVSDLYNGGAGLPFGPPAGGASNCWTYDAVNKITAIPVGCMYYIATGSMGSISAFILGLLDKTFMRGG